MAKTEPKHDETEKIKEDYRVGSIDFVCAMLELREIGHVPAQAQKIVAELIKEKHNGPRDN